MKIQIILTALFSIFFIASLQAQTTKTFELGEFSVISLNSDYRITVRQSNKQEVKVKADPEILGATNLWVDNGVLHVDVKSDDQTKKSLLKKLENKLTATMELDITVRNLNKIIVNGNGSVTGDNSISAPMLELEMNGNGKINIDARSTRVRASIFSPGEITLSGYGDMLQLNVSGNGKFNATSYDTKRVTAEVRGMETKCNLSVSEALDIKVYGSAEVFYKGEVKDIKKQVFGTGFVLFRNL